MTQQLPAGGGASAPAEDDGELERINSELARAWDASLRERALRARSESTASAICSSVFAPSL